MTLSCLLFVNLNFGCVSVEGSFVFVRFMYPIFVQAFHIYMKYSVGDDARYSLSCLPCFDSIQHSVAFGHVIDSPKC